MGIEDPARAYGPREGGSASAMILYHRAAQLDARQFFLKPSHPRAIVDRPYPSPKRERGSRA